MRSRLRGKVMFLASLTGMALYFGWLGTALAAEAEAAPHLDWTDFAYRTAAAVVVVYILVKLLRKPTVNFLNSRREEIRSLLAELEAKTAAAGVEQERAQARLASLQEETKKIVGELIAEGEAERDKIIEAARREADYIQQQAQIAIEQEIQAARDSLKDEIADMSVSAAHDIIKKKIRAEDQQRLVREFMTKVAEAK